ncbi:hypothetical protein HPP92_008472 [Vanilla planifolia]|uniref:Uncharacterized protein n=1 Tax=Vanilla planifolia TaxID=51239 RepID=A0A835R665_VANPL|nr:hypothetical protein HPP92_008472 [Vanilla planifolia]
MAQIPNVDNSPLNLAALRESSQKELINILKNVRGKKCLVIDPKLGGSLSLLIQTSLLKENGVELRHLSAEPVQTECSKVLYLVRPQLNLMKFISSHILNDVSKGLQKEYFVYFVPRRTVVCEKIFEDEKVRHLLTLGEYPLYIMPLDEDVLSCELDTAFRECLVDGDMSSLWHVAKAIHKLEVDMVTPMCFQLTYEGLLDEVLREKATSMQKDYADVKSTSQSVSELKDFVKKLNSLPEIARHVSLAQHLQTFTCKPSFHSRLDIEQTILESQNFDICFEYIEEMIHKQEPIINVFRLLVLLSVTNSGLPKKTFDYLRREILHGYGFEHMPTLYILEKAGLFKRQESKSNWQMISKALQLIASESEASKADDISYIFSGYAPLSIRLVQHAIRSGWRSIEEIIKLLPGPQVDFKRGSSTSNSSFDRVPGLQSNLDRLGDGRRALVLVVIVGGITFAEIAALRFLSSQDGLGYDFIIATTKMVNGNTLLEALLTTK